MEIKAKTFFYAYSSARIYKGGVFAVTTFIHAIKVYVESGMWSKWNDIFSGLFKLLGISNDKNFFNFLLFLRRSRMY